jgi:hypothetical protein
VRHTLTCRYLALLGPSKTQGGVDSASSVASEQYVKALAAASSVLYGTKQSAVESATSVAAERYAQAITAASYAIYGTPTPTAIIKTVQVEVRTRVYPNDLAKLSMPIGMRWLAKYSKLYQSFFLVFILINYRTGKLPIQ